MALQRMTKQNPWYMCLVVSLVLFLFLFFGFALFIGFLANVSDVYDVVPGLGWFDEASLSDIGNRYEIDIIPADYAFYMWLFVYPCQLAWILYVLTSLCRRNQDGGAVFTNPPIITPFFLIVFCLNLSFGILWEFLYTGDLLSWSLVAVFLMHLTLEINRVTVHLCVDKYGEELRRKYNNDLWAIRILILNGLALYSSWTVIATLINLGMVMTFKGDVSQSASTTTCLVIIACYVVGTFVLDTFVWDKYMRYNFANWGIYIWALVGIFVRDWIEPDTNLILTLLILIMTIALLGLKVPLVVWRHRNRPLYML